MSSPSASKYLSPGRVDMLAFTHPVGVFVDIPIPLSSQTKSSGRGTPCTAVQQAALIAPCAVEWLSEASPKEHMAIASRGRIACSGRLRRASVIEWAAPTALGRWLAMVEVCGGIISDREPRTLWRPPLVGSSEEQAKDSNMSRIMPS